MFRRTRTLALLAAGGLVATVLAAPPGSAGSAGSAGSVERVGTRSWSPLTASASPNFAQAAVARTADGTQHVVWIVDNPDRTHNYEHTTISPSGSQGPVTRVLATDWAQLSTPVDLGVNADGSLRLAFRGTVDGNTANFFTYKGVYTAVSVDGGTSWAVPREVLATSNTDGGVTMAYVPGGTPITGFGDTAGFHWHVGAIPEAAQPTTVNSEFTDHDAMAATLVSSGAAVHVVYQSAHADGVLARQVWPTLGAPVRGPGSYTNPGQPMAVVDRPGVGPVAAYTVDDEVVLWDVLADRTRRVPGMRGASAVELAVLPDGHLWVVATGPIGYDPRASRVSARGWTIDRRPSTLPDPYSSFGISVTSADALRAELLLLANDSGDPTRLHARSVAAQMVLRATPARWRVGRAQRVVFKVTDVDGGVARVKVRAGGRRCTTNGAGRCAIRFPGQARPGRITVRATARSYYPVKAKLRVVR